MEKVETRKRRRESSRSLSENKTDAKKSAKRHRTASDMAMAEPVRVETIEGLTIHPHFVSSVQANTLWRILREQPWRRDLSRDTLHYGVRYDYKTRQLCSDVPPIPEWLEELTDAVQKRVITAGDKIEQIIVNRYLEGQGIAPHIDSIGLFGPVVVTLTLGSEVPIRFERDSQSIHVRAPACSLMVMCGESRFEWKHSLKLKGCGERISVTFRTLNKRRDR